MNWNTSIRVKDDKNVEHILQVETSRPAFGLREVVDIFIDEMDPDGGKIKSWDMRYDLLKKFIVFPQPTTFDKNIVAEMETIIETGAEEW